MPMPPRIKLSHDPEHRLDGYHVKDANSTRRRQALVEAALAKPGADTVANLLKVQRRVQVLSLFFRKSNLTLARRAAEDVAYVRQIRLMVKAALSRA